MSRTLRLLMVVATIVALTACDTDRRAISRDDLPELDLAPVAEVHVDDTGFDPDSITITAGDLFTVTNEGTERHGGRSDDGVLDTTLLAPGDTVTMRLTTVGTHEATDARSGGSLTVTVVADTTDTDG